MKGKDFLKQGIAWLLSAAVLFASVSLPAAFTSEKAEAASYELVWSDEFDGNSLDTSKWNYEIGTGSNGWGNAELEYYTNRSENASVYDGVLHINARREDYNGSQYTSARIQTHGKFDFTYGRVEARLRIPKGNAFWPAFWLLGSNYGTSAWPSCGEIDIMEHVNYEDNTNGHLHWGANSNVGNAGDHADYGNASYVNNITDWHVYSIEWTSQYIKWFVDGVEYQTVDTTGWDMEEFHHDYFIILNFAIGGYWPQWNVNAAEFPASFDVDYVRVYQLKEGSEGTEAPTDAFVAASVADGQYYLKGVNTGKVVCADNYGNDILLANRDAYGGEWEQLTLVNNADGTVSLLSGANNQYVCMVYDDQCQLIARSTAIDAWEKFYLVQVTEDQYALRSAVNNLYVTVNENDSNKLYATAGSVQAWEVFHLYTTDGKQITASTTPEESTQEPETTPAEPETESQTQPSQEESSSDAFQESSSEPEESSSGTELVKPSKVTGVKAVYEDGKVKLTWDDNGAAQYRVMRFTSETGYTTRTYKATADGYIDTDMIEAQLYYYRICGYFYDAEGKLVQGNVSDSAAVVATDKEPKQVTNLTAEISDSGITLNWDAAEGVRYYKIARARGWSTAEGSYTCLKYNVSETAYTDKPDSYGNWRYKVAGYYKNTDGSWVYGPMSATLFLTYEEPEEKPVEQKELSEDTINFYTRWKEHYVVKNPYVTDETQYYVWYSGKKYSDNQSQVAVTVSEAHGYGMLTAVSMARYDSEAKEIFDGMYRYYRAHLSEVGPNLMAWQQADNGSALIDSAGANSATDGDLDIAYALLMADSVWGSDGEIDYKQAAINVINDIMTYEVNQEDWILRLGDWTYWSGKGDQYYAATRASDFIVQYMPVFAEVTNDDRWLNVYNRTYEIINSIVDQYGTGILPDFIIKDSSTGKFVPAPANFLESDYDGSCYYNSCRTPWRISMDYLINGNEDALNFATALNTFIVNATGGNPNGIRAGYKLDGTVIGNYSDLCFTAPFVVAAGCGGFDNWHSAVRNNVVNHGIDSYYADSIKMLCLIADDGGWIVP